MHGAVTIPEMYTTFFLGELPENREGLEVDEGAWVEIPDLRGFCSGRWERP